MRLAFEDATDGSGPCWGGLMRVTALPLRVGRGPRCAGFFPKLFPLREAEDQSPPFEPSIIRWRWLAWSTVHRACRCERARSPREQIRWPESWAIFPLVLLFELVPKFFVQAWLISPLMSGFRAVLVIHWCFWFYEVSLAEFSWPFPVRVFDEPKAPSPHG